MKELVHFNGNNISFSAAVSRVAEALSPLAALRGVVASIGACAVEISQINLERQKLANAQRQISAYLKQRQYEVEIVFYHQNRIASEAKVKGEQILKSHTLMLEQACSPHVPSDERMICHQLIPTLNSQILLSIKQDSEQIIHLSEALSLGSISQLISLWRP